MSEAVPKFVVFLFMLALSGCVTTSPASREPRYFNEYGAFYSPVDAACAYLHQPEQKAALGDKWQSEFGKCQQRVTDANYEVQTRQQAQRQQNIQQTLETLNQVLNPPRPAPPPVQPAPTMAPTMQTTNCRMVGNMLSCNTF